MFEGDFGKDYHVFWDTGDSCFSYWTNPWQHHTPFILQSIEAFNAFKSAPENVELFKTFLKIK